MSKTIHKGNDGRDKNAEWSGMETNREDSAAEMGTGQDGSSRHVEDKFRSSAPLLPPIFWSNSMCFRLKNLNPLHCDWSLSQTRQNRRHRWAVASPSTQHARRSALTQDGDVCPMNVIYDYLPANDRGGAFHHLPRCSHEVSSSPLPRLAVKTGSGE